MVVARMQVTCFTDCVILGGGIRGGGCINGARVVVATAVAVGILCASTTKRIVFGCGLVVVGGVIRVEWFLVARTVEFHFGECAVTGCVWLHVGPGQEWICTGVRGLRVAHGVACWLVGIARRCTAYAVCGC